MKTFKLALVLALALCSSVLANAQTKKELKYVDALEFRMINHGFDNTQSPYHRIPGYLKDSIMKDPKRAALWDRGRNCAGMAIRFSSNSERIGIRYNLLWNFHMAHMADTGIKGTDLYILNDEGVWEYVNTNRPVKDSIQSKIYADGLPKDRMHEYMIYLPLYDGVNWMEIGVDSSAVIQKPLVNNPRKETKVVFYRVVVLPVQVWLQQAWYRETLTWSVSILVSAVKARWISSWQRLWLPFLMLWHLSLTLSLTVQRICVPTLHMDL